MERRIDQRGEFSKPVTIEVSAATSIETINAETLNISKGGACIVTDLFLEPGKVVMFKRPSEDMDLKLPGLGEVRWVVSAEGRFTTGIRFLK
jgi:hypothetical protein